jgi:hypothetical protein
MSVKLIRQVPGRKLRVTGFPGTLDGSPVLGQVDEGCSKTSPVRDAGE